MRDTYLSMKKQLHIVMLICQDISYVELLMGMLNAGLDNDGMETDALHAYYNEISKDSEVSVPMTWLYPTWLDLLWLNMNFS